jgi:hypothetical protein
VRRDVADVVPVRLELLDLVHRVVVVDAHGHVVRARDDPLLARDKLGGADGQVRQLERLDERLLGWRRWGGGVSRRRVGEMAGGGGKQIVGNT